MFRHSRVALRCRPARMGQQAGSSSKSLHPAQCSTHAGVAQYMARPPIIDKFALPRARPPPQDIRPNRRPREVQNQRRSTAPMKPTKAPTIAGRAELQPAAADRLRRDAERGVRFPLTRQRRTCCPDARRVYGWTLCDGGVAEWFKALVLKTSVGGSSPWVRIPPPPPYTPRSKRTVTVKWSPLLTISTLVPPQH